VCISSTEVKEGVCSSLLNLLVSLLVPNSLIGVIRVRNQRKRAVTFSISCHASSCKVGGKNLIIFAPFKFKVTTIRLLSSMPSPSNSSFITLRKLMTIQSLIITSFYKILNKVSVLTLILLASVSKKV